MACVGREGTALFCSSISCRSQSTSAHLCFTPEASPASPSPSLLLPDSSSHVSRAANSQLANCLATERPGAERRRREEKKGGGWKGADGGSERQCERMSEETAGGADSSDGATPTGTLPSLSPRQLQTYLAATLLLCNRQTRSSVPYTQISLTLSLSLYPAQHRVEKESTLLFVSVVPRVVCI